MTETNIQLRQPAKLDYASPIQFRFKCTKLPEVEFTCQTANIPGISLGSASQPTPLVDVAIPGDKLSYQSLDISFLVDENSFLNLFSFNGDSSPTAQFFHNSSLISSNTLFEGIEVPSSQ